MQEIAQGAIQAISTATSTIGAQATSFTAQSSLVSSGQNANTAASPQPFSDLMTDSIQQVDQLETQADVAVRGLISGSGMDVHQVMIATQKAGMAFQMALALRNKAVQSYQTVMGMQF